MSEIPKAYIPKPKRRPWQPQRVAFEGITARTTFYSNAPWRKFRKMFLQQNPLCQSCNEQGKANAATEVHHINAVNPDNPFDNENGKFGQPLDASNCKALCFDCHVIETSKRKHNA